LNGVISFHFSHGISFVSELLYYSGLTSDFRASIAAYLRDGSLQASITGRIRPLLGFTPMTLDVGPWDLTPVTVSGIDPAIVR
jgi:hypothetical protein